MVCGSNPTHYNVWRKVDCVVCGGACVPEQVCTEGECQQLVGMCWVRARTVCTEGECQFLPEWDKASACRQSAAVALLCALMAGAIRSSHQFLCSLVHSQSVGHIVDPPPKPPASPAPAPTPAPPILPVDLPPEAGASFRGRFPDARAVIRSNS
jgi:hypothetical protein